MDEQVRGMIEMLDLTFEYLRDLARSHPEAANVRLWSDPVSENDDQFMWVDFEIIEVLGFEKDGRECYNRRDSSRSPDPLYELDNAEPIASGFVKWDGCTQFNADIHIDGRAHLEHLLEAIAEARRLAAELMGNLVGDEY
jgi:hypothetical protein